MTEHDARAEAELQWPSYRAVGFSGADDRQAAFVAGAVWADAQQATGGEPVAWEITYQHMTWVTSYPEQAEAYRDDRHTVTPLYRHPALSPADTSREGDL